ncbi:MULTISPECIES: copper-containing nitrite reductase [unclassified Mesorhizobium]|uniref:copper-containing nitrite reductase n=1 Tax=unclassified Mesorhizobium TaxID=325217 RepID=UPI0003CE8672|nr:MULTISPECIES: copper-containing nitrite reductase [unclassified Mesorhizobium]ESW84871.1 nitrite reductase [Mesorhizobium sp. LSJC269B00]ESZ02715.1 nitrite reductase [Mesorhizobium sp. L2C089B000]ESZ54066.1 nitrite reductase [Mesorhizobium sp. L103C120A0]WJI42539.1 copper-containing nitrite reductase [Mesorhizobium sp. C120A]WJI50635.1 copper-containing nitrite reductase [Mesorhizobium sp. C089B]
MITRREALFGAAIGAAAVAALPALSATVTKADIRGLPRDKVKLVAPPFVHPHDQIAKGGPKIVEFTITIEEKPMVIDADGTQLNAMTYNGSIPGPLMVVHQDDYVELTLINPDTNSLAHNIDFHAATGALGGGALTLINPGEQVTLRFKATRTGTFVYHCAPGGPMIPWHVVSGMNGAIMVLPRDGLRNDKGEPVKYDKIFYIGESDFYIPRDEKGNYKSYESAGDGYDDIVKVMRGLIPTHVVFNGRAGSLTGDNAMKAKVGETVLIVHSQANRDTRPHLIGGHGDYVWEQGKFANPPAKDLETWFIRGGSAGSALYTFLQPGVYAYVNHNLIEAVELGATAHFMVEGEWDDDLMTQVEAPKPIATN